MKRLKFHLLTLLAIFAFLLAAFVAWLRFFFIPWMANDALWVLNRFYAPTRKPANVTYDDLYTFAMQSVQARKSDVCFYQSIICVILILLGILILLWRADAKRMSSLTKGKGQGDFAQKTSP